MKSLVVARYTFSELFQSKILYNVFFISISLFILTYVASEFTYGTPKLVALDFGIAASSLSTIVISIFLGANLVTREIENRTLFMVLSRPISRTSFFLGKVIGLMGISIVNNIILALVSVFLYFVMGGEFSSLIIWTYFFILIESLIVLLIVICFSLVTNIILSVINTIVIYVASYAVYESISLPYVQSREGLSGLLEVLSFFLPSLSKYNLKTYIMYESHVPSNFLIFGTLYGITYILILLLICLKLFNNKNLD